MIKLSDYLDYLNNEIIQARKKADENAIRVAKEYAEHQYLKYFKVPRYSIPSIKMDIPLKISDIDAETKQEFKVDKSKLLLEVNDKIKLINASKKLNIAPITDTQLNNDTFKGLFDKIEKFNEAPVIVTPPVKPVVAQPDKPIAPAKPILTGTVITNIPPKPVIKPADVEKAVKSLNLGVFKTADSSTDAESTALRNIFAESLSSNFHIVSSKLNNIYIDPDTTKNEDKDKLFLNLHVEMEEESIRLVRLQDGSGNTVEEITFE